MSEKEQKEVKYTAKERLFISAYLGDARFNGTLAARMAGYSGSDNVLGVTAYNLLRNPKIKTAIDEGLAALTMPSNEVLARLTNIAKGKVTDIVNDEGKFDLEKAKENGSDALLKKIKVKRNTRVIREADEFGKFDEEIETSILTEEIEFELYSAHEALRDLGKYHKLFTERQEIEARVEHSVDDETVKKVKDAYDRFRNRS